MSTPGATNAWSSPVVSGPVDSHRPSASLAVRKLFGRTNVRPVIGWVAGTGRPESVPSAVATPLAKVVRYRIRLLLAVTSTASDSGAQSRVYLISAVRVVRLTGAESEPRSVSVHPVASSRTVSSSRPTGA